MALEAITNTLPWIIGVGGLGVIGWLVYKGIIKPLLGKELPKLFGKKQVIGTNKNQNEAIAFMLSLNQRLPVETNTPEQQQERERQMINSGFNPKLIQNAQKAILKQRLNVRLENGTKRKSELGQEEASTTQRARDDRGTEIGTGTIRRDAEVERRGVLSFPSPDDFERDKREPKRTWKHNSSDG